VGDWRLQRPRRIHSHVVHDYEIVADNLLNGETRSVRDRITAYGLFIDPPLGRAGMTDDEIRKSGARRSSACAR
jgi:pyruvate/2-oxoglutarate dehydrogenase complex dihydrolipoamide dehydrogenase (E3) component